MAKTIAYIPASLASSLSNLPITKIIIAAHETNLASNTPGTNAKTNHWVFHLVISPNASIRLDLSPTGDSAGTACLIISQLPYVVSNNAIKTCEVPAQSGITARDVVDSILAACYDRYRFTPGGQGCRHWVSTVLGLLESRSITMSPDQTHAGQAALRTVWGRGGAPVPAEQQTGIVPGSFY